MDAVGLYLSVPFCKAKCTFCHFASDAFPPERMAGYAARLQEEVRGAHGFASLHGLELSADVDTVFLGGGTPSLLEPGQMAGLFHTLRENFALRPGAEITVEAAPGQIGDALLDTLLQCGVNRISLGVQSFVDVEARAVGRSHTGAACLEEIARLRRAGVANLSVDLIAGMPYQAAQSWSRSLRSAIDSGVDHVSVYMLEVDEGSRLGRELIGPGVRYGAQAVPTDEAVADLYTQACQTLTAAGLEQYEISNFARPGRESRHNSKYWTRSPYLGFGLDAHSMLHAVRGSNAVRFANTGAMNEYLAGDFARSLEPVDALSAWEETVFLGMRRNCGLSLSALRAQHAAVWVNSLEAAAFRLERDGLLCLQQDRIHLTQQGRLLSSSVFAELLLSTDLAA